MTIITKAELHDEVLIRCGEEKIPGIIVSFWQTSKGLQYEVVFWNNGKREKEYFFEKELEFGGTQ
jgi:hypothetical protein